MNNIYSGQVIPSWHQFDKIYNSYAEAQQNVDIDNVLLGRYVLIAYTDMPLSYSDRMVVLSTVYTSNNNGEQEIVSANISSELTEDQKTYQRNLLNDGGIDYDRIVCQKEWDGNGFNYRPIANISETIDFANTDNNAFLQAFENIVREFDEIATNAETVKKELEAAIENADSLLGTAVWTDF